MKKDVEIFRKPYEVHMTDGKATDNIDSPTKQMGWLSYSNAEQVTIVIRYQDSPVSFNSCTVYLDGKKVKELGKGNCNFIFGAEIIRHPRPERKLGFGAMRYVYTQVWPTLEEVLVDVSKTQCKHVGFNNHIYRHFKPQPCVEQLTA